MRSARFSKWINLYVLSLFLNFVNLSVYAAIGTATVFSILRESPNTLVPNCLAGGSSLLLLSTELHLSRIAVEYFRFITTLRGRGMVYILLGFVSYQENYPANMLVCYYATALGICYEILSFLPQLLPLNDIKRNWKAYRQYCEEYNASFCTDGSGMPSGSVYNRHQTSTIRAGRNSEDKAKPMNEFYSRESQISEKDRAQLAMEINDALIQVQYSDFATISPPAVRPLSDTEYFFPRSYISSVVGSRNSSIAGPRVQSQYNLPKPHAAKTVRNIYGAGVLPPINGQDGSPVKAELARHSYYHQHHRSHPGFSIPNGDYR
ncbi:hypothetical protein DSO57_1030709 [Entomophthora muscae]|uniref:Uncharacterized protein n=1 Tax=Entomophthora muscae TaxID=34485 RepID=A0ACC2TZG5_9FUNG|nr:hypothetical protein DSO57_1030709 [Entomophthora muscae]